MNICLDFGETFWETDWNICDCGSIHFREIPMNEINSTMDGHLLPGESY